MASPQILKSTSSSFSISRSKSLRKSRCFCSEFNSEVVGKRIPRFRSNRSSKLVLMNRRFKVCCKVEEGDSKSNGEEPPESLFMKELRRRGMSPTSLLEESQRSVYADEDIISYREEDGGFTNRNFVSTDVEKTLFNQRERSMALNSEGLEFSKVESFVSVMSSQGLIPRAKLLLAIGGTFFLAFWQLILLTIASFCALYLYFGSTFVHDGTDNDTSVSPPPYVDPYALLEDQRISQTAPLL